MTIWITKGSAPALTYPFVSARITNQTQNYVPAIRVQRRAYGIPIVVPKNT